MSADDAGPMEWPRSLGALLEAAARRYPERIAVSDGLQNVSYRRLWETSLGAASQLRRLGLSPGELVALECSNDIDSMTLLLGCWLARCAALPIPGHSLLEEGTIPRLVCWGVSSVVCAGAELPHRQYFRYVLQRKILTGGSEGRSATLDSISPVDPALVVFSSGSTAEPKAVLFTHEQLGTHVLEQIELFRIESSDRSLVTLQLNRPFCLTSQILPMLAAGAELRLSSSNARVLYEEIAECTSWYLYPEQLRQCALSEESVRPSRLRYAAVGAGFLPPATLSAFHARYRVPVHACMGSAETLMLAANVSEDPGKRGSAGKVLPSVELRIGGPLGEPLSAGRGGEILVRSKKFGRVIATGKSRDERKGEDWLSLGDAGLLDAEGFLWALGRLEDWSSEIARAPFQIESLAAENLHISELAVFRREGAEYFSAALVLANNSDSLRAEVLETLPGDVGEVLFLERLPRLPSGKVNRHGLRSLNPDFRVRRREELRPRSA